MHLAMHICLARIKFSSFKDTFATLIVSNIAKVTDVSLQSTGYTCIGCEPPI